MKEKEYKIVSEILKIPFEKWNGYETKLNNGLKVFLNPTHTNLPKYLEIEDVRFFDERINEFFYNLKEFRLKKDEDEKNSKINKIYESLCSGD